MPGVTAIPSYSTLGIPFKLDFENSHVRNVDTKENPPLAHLTGLLIAESLKNQSILSSLKISKTETWDVENTEKGQPERWTALTFEADEEEAEELAKSLSLVIRPEWYANFSTTTHVFLILENRVFCYVKGDKAARAEAESYAVSVGIPISQVDWSE